MKDSKEILIGVIKRLSIWMQTGIFISVLCSSIILASAFSSMLSYDKSLLQSAQIFILTSEEKISEIEKNNSGNLSLLKPNGRYANLAPFERWSKEDILNYSNLIYSQSRAINAVNKIKLIDEQRDGVKDPIIGFQISSINVDIAMGIVCIAMYIWVYALINQLIHLFTDRRSEQILSNDMWSIKYIFPIYNFQTGFLSVCFVLFVILLPLISMFISIYFWYDVFDAIETVAYSDIIRGPYIKALGARVLILILLFCLTVCVAAGWFVLTSRLRRYEE